jgi:F0F1-type ATP synthase assembly protein I
VPALDAPATKALGLAWGFGWRIGAGLFLGYYLDRWLGTGPLLMVVFTIGSFIAGIVEFVRVAASTRRRDPTENPEPEE